MSCSRGLGPRRARAAVVPLLLAALVGVGCGEDDEKPAATTGSGEPPTRTVTAPVQTTTTPERERTSTTPPKLETKGGGPASPEDQPGGAGDEEPVRSEVVLTGRGGRIGPLLVKVPPFVSIRVVLRSADGKPYVMRFGPRVVRVGLKGSSSSATFDGLRPGRRLAGIAPAGRVIIEASAEPGP